MQADRKLRLLTSHGAVLMLLAHRPRQTATELARDAGLTERQVLRVLRDLVTQGYVRPQIEGNRRRYEVVPERPLDARPGFAGLRVADILPIADALARARGRRSRL